MSVFSLYGCAVAYADFKMNNRAFIGNLFGIANPNPNAAQKYVDAVLNKDMEPLDFTLDVPPGFGANGTIPNVCETSDPETILTTVFDQGRITWPDERLNVSDS